MAKKKVPSSFWKRFISQFDRQERMLILGFIVIPISCLSVGFIYILYRLSTF